MTDRARLQRLLGGPELAWLVDRVRTRLERGEGLEGQALLARPSPAQRAAVAGLLGRPPGRGAKLAVALPEVDALLRRAGVADGLSDAVVALRGPLADLPAARVAEEAAWAATFTQVDALADARPELAPWRDELRMTGLLRRTARGDPDRARVLLDQAVAVLDRLPSEPVPRSLLAAEALGDGHALDQGRPVATLVLRAARVLAGVPAGDGAEWRREVWAGVGVLVSDLAAPALTLGLPGDVATPTGRALAVWAEAGQPVHLTLRQLVRDPPRLPLAGRGVFVCENPTVVSAAADALGPACAPLVCVSGQPTAAVKAVLRLLAERGATLRYHGDFDWGGVTIANTVMARFPARPWRFDAAAYRAALPAAGGPLRGTPVPATWDPELTDALIQHGRRIEEEAVAADLLADLTRPGV